jgi:hypothetical protein
VIPEPVNPVGNASSDLTSNTVARETTGLSGCFTRDFLSGAFTYGRFHHFQYLGVPFWVDEECVNRRIEPGGRLF